MTHPIRQLREERGWTLAQLAEASGLTLKTIWNIEVGAVAPRQDTQRKLLVALSRPFEDRADLF